MLVGTFRGVQLADEGFLVPQPLRRALEQGFVMTRGLDGCVAVFPLPTWDVLLDRIEQDTSFLAAAARLFQRYVYGGATVDSLGAQDRLTIPDHLQTYAELGDEVVVVGVATRIEIWNSERWNDEESSLQEQAEQVSEALSEAWT